MKEDVRLTKHFTLQEMVRSATAIRFGIPNEVTPDAVFRLRALCINVLEPLRQRYGRIIVTSGFRSPELNAAVGGSPRSQHLRGEAADIYIGSSDKAHKYAKFIIENTDFDQLIFEPVNSEHVAWLHVSYTERRPNRRKIVGRRNV